MPRIDNTSLSSPSHQRSFKKKSYRPWGLLDDDFNLEIEQIGHKTDTNQAQIEHKQDTNRTPNIEKKHKPDTNQKRTEYKLDTESDTKNTAYRTQTEHKPDTKHAFFTLVGLQRKIILFFYENCKKTRNKETEPFALEYIADQLNICLGSVKTTIRRLQTKNFIKRIDFKNGRSGWSRYEVPNDLFSEIMQLETEHKLREHETQTEHKANTKLNTGFYSSSCNIYKTTTTGETENQENENFAEWQNLDIEPLSGINFTTTHLRQIASQNKLSPEIVQDSIYAFAFDLQENNKATKIKGDPINFFMGILRNGKPYTPPSNYESPQDKAMRIYLENIRATEQRRVDMEKEAITLAFNNWFSKLSNEQKIEFLPEMLRRGATSEKLEKSKQLEVSAKSYFEREIWPDEKAKIVADI